MDPGIMEANRRIFEQLPSVEKPPPRKSKRYGMCFGKLCLNFKIGSGVLSILFG
jgi:hypothetical protein